MTRITIDPVQNGHQSIGSSRKPVFLLAKKRNLFLATFMHTYTKKKSHIHAIISLNIGPQQGSQSCVQFVNYWNNDNAI